MEHLMFTLSSKLKEALDKWSYDHDQSRASVMRQALAKFIGYDLSQDERKRASKYATEEERKAARRAAAKERRKLNAAILREFRTTISDAELRKLLEDK